MSRLWLPITLVVLLAGVLGWLLEGWDPSGERVRSIPSGGDFTLQSDLGPVSLRDFRGSVVTLYFGYTWCPDICPTSLAAQMQAIAGLAPSEAERVRPLFISVDPARDSVGHLRTYADYFHPRLLGLTGSPEDLARVAASYGAVYRIAQVQSAADYAVDHSADLYVIDAEGRLFATLPHGTTPTAIRDVLRDALAKR